jgi:hypothetical protein
MMQEQFPSTAVQIQTVINWTPAVMSHNVLHCNMGTHCQNPTSLGNPFRSHGMHRTFYIILGSSSKSNLSSIEVHGKVCEFRGIVLISTKLANFATLALREL